MRLKLTVLLAFLALFGVLQLAAKSAENQVKFTPSKGVDPATVVKEDSIIPRLPDNSVLAVEKLLPKESIISKAGLLPADAVDKGTELTTLGKFQASHHILKDTQVSPNRQVWIVKASFPNGFTTGNGTYKNATVSKTFDAETGEYLGLDIDFHQGDFVSNGIHH